MTGLKKKLDLRLKEKVLLIERENDTIPMTTQAKLLGVARSTVYYKPKVNSYNLKLMHFIDEQYTKTPFYGSRRMREPLNEVLTIKAISTIRGT